MNRLDFLIIGAQKSGTTSLRAFLSTLPEKVYISRRELHFWNRDGQYRDGRGLEDYLANFRAAQSHQLIGEKSPSYLPSESAPGRIAAHFPEVKLIAILRNPVERAYSAYWHGRRVGAIDSENSFSEVIRSYKENQGRAYGDVVSQGLYSQHIERYLKNFPREQMLFLEFDQLRASPDSQLRLTLDFLGISLTPEKAQSQLAFPRRNVARQPRSERVSQWLHGTKLLNPTIKSKIIKRNLKEFQVPPMLAEDQVFLRKIYSREAENLFALTGQEFPW